MSTLSGYDQSGSEHRLEGPTPAGIAVLCTLIVEAAILLGIYAVSCFALASRFMEPGAAVLGAGFLIAAILSFIVAWGLWYLRRWALTMALILSAATAVLAFITVILGNTWCLVGVVFELIVICCLWNRREHFLD